MSTGARGVREPSRGQCCLPAPRGRAPEALLCSGTGGPRAPGPALARGPFPHAAASPPTGRCRAAGRQPARGLRAHPGGAEDARDLRLRAWPTRAPLVATAGRPPRGWLCAGCKGRLRALPASRARRWAAGIWGGPRGRAPRAGPVGGAAPSRHGATPPHVGALRARGI